MAIIDDNKQKKINAALDKIKKQFGAEAMMKMSDKPELDIDAISSGSLSLDIALGVGGYPKGRIVQMRLVQDKNSST